MLWTVVLTLPLMIAIQLVSARIGYITRRGLAATIKHTGQQVPSSPTSSRESPHRNSRA
jgi:Mn2+/Fe2+ NRAMP family transporter